MMLGCITSRWENGASRTVFQIGMNSAITRMSGPRLTKEDSLKCQREGYYLTGVNRGGCNYLHCIDSLDAAR